jgi:hypothetical protein
MRSVLPAVLLVEGASAHAAGRRPELTPNRDLSAPTSDHEDAACEQADAHCECEDHFVLLSAGGFLPDGADGWSRTTTARREKRIASPSTS